MKLVIVKWIDSYANSRCYNDEEINDWIKSTEKSPIISVGFLFKKTKKYVILYSDNTGEEKARCLKIPKKMIRNIILIKNINYGKV